MYCMYMFVCMKTFQYVSFLLHLQVSNSCEYEGADENRLATARVM